MTTTTRDEFEDWYCKAYHPHTLQNKENGCYLNFQAGMAWDAWQAATLAAQSKRQPLTGDDIQTIIEMLARHQTFNNEPDCPVVAMCRKLKNMLDEIAPPQGKI